MSHLPRVTCQVVQSLNSHLGLLAPNPVLFLKAWRTETQGSLGRRSRGLLGHRKEMVPESQEVGPGQWQQSGHCLDGLGRMTAHGDSKLSRALGFFWPNLDYRCSCRAW